MTTISLLGILPTSSSKLFQKSSFSSDWHVVRHMHWQHSATPLWFPATKSCSVWKPLHLHNTIHILFLFKITPTPLLSTPLYNNLNPVYLVCWSQHLLDNLADIVPILTYRSLFFISLAACKHVFPPFIFLLSLANNSTVCRKSHFLIHIWFAKDCYVGRPFWHNPPWSLAWDQGSPNKWLSAKKGLQMLVCVMANILIDSGKYATISWVY